MDDRALIESRRLIAPPGKDYWVFAYGSLMWRPDFPHKRLESALLHGYHRAFCIRSIRYRGTPKKPGLVLGLARGGSCVGRALLVAAEHGQEVADYLHGREMITGVYMPRWLRIRLGDRKRARIVTAVGFVADPHHEQYCPPLDDASLTDIILAGRGASGPNVDYLEATVRHLDELNIRESRLHRILRCVEQAKEAKR